MQTAHEKRNPIGLQKSGQRFDYYLPRVWGITVSALAGAWRGVVGR